MKNLILKVFIVVLSAFCFLDTAAAVNYEASGGKVLDNHDVQARAFLKKEASALCLPNDSDSEKVKKLNKYVCDTAEYDYSNTAEGLKDFVYKGKAICSGYAETLAYLLDCENIKNFMITDFVYSTYNLKVLHIWNAVYIDGQWLHVDPTWNDETRNAANPDGKYFLLTNREISVNRQALLFNTIDEYNHFYSLLRTAMVSIDAADTLDVSAAQNGRMLVSLEKTAYALGAYTMQEESGKVAIILGTRTLEMTVGSDKGNMDGREFTFDAAPQMIHGKIMIPARMAYEKLGATVYYDNATSVVTISYDPFCAT